MTPELVPSKTLQRAAATERERLARALERNRDRQAAIRAELEELEVEKHKLEDRDRLLRDISGTSSEMGTGDSDIPTQGDALKGAELREMAARIYYQQHGAGHAGHYRDWFDLLAKQGVEISGKDPVATLLTNLNRSPVVVRGPEAGTYAIDEDAPKHLRSRLGELHAEFADLARVIEESDVPTTDLLRHRTELLSEIRRTERLVAEAERVLAPLAKAA